MGRILRESKTWVWTLFSVCSAIAFAQTGTLHGKVTLIDPGGSDEPLEAGDVVLYLDGINAPIPQPLIDKAYVISTKDKQFFPQLMIIPSGATIQFPNLDPIIHNVFSVSGQNRFDAGRYSKGEGKGHTFSHSGLVRIYCNVHHAMNALVYVAENPFFGTIDTDGNYEIKGIPPGSYQLVALHLRAGQEEMKVTLVAGERKTLDVELKLRKGPAKKHLNKYGKPYKNSRKRY